jgi:hypothetical protein
LWTEQANRCLRDVIPANHQVDFLTVDVKYPPTQHSLSGDFILSRKILDDGCAGTVGAREKIGTMGGNMG